MFLLSQTIPFNEIPYATFISFNEKGMHFYFHFGISLRPEPVYISLALYHINEYSEQKYLHVVGNMQNACHVRKAHYFSRSR